LKQLFNASTWSNAVEIHWLPGRNGLEKMKMVQLLAQKCPTLLWFKQMAREIKRLPMGNFMGKMGKFWDSGTSSLETGENLGIPGP